MVQNQTVNFLSQEVDRSNIGEEGHSPEFLCSLMAIGRYQGRGQERNEVKPGPLNWW